ncbi:MAG: AAA family ATPase [bacterium]|nr:AAA family ATPase [bacterium]
MADKTIKRIPYGLANYERVVQRNCYYVDKTMYLKTVEESGDYLFFIRPRRFGKSLFLAVMEAYFDVFYKDRFEEFFKGTWIYDQPTGEKSSYLVLSLNFSVVEPQPVKMETSFHNHIQDAAVNFMQRYYELLSANRDRDYFVQKIKESRSASDILSTLLQLCKGARQKLYVLIDEYDNFSNTILASIGKDAYHDLTHGPGFFRSFFNVLKNGTSGTGAPISRSFITGVSPVTMDDVTSGYNIGKNVSLEPALNRMLGFTRDDVLEMVEYYRSKGQIEHSSDYLLEIMTDWYGNYRFSRKDNVKLFNSDMILYFLDNYMGDRELPDDLIDRNVRIDYGKLRHLIIMDKGDKKVSNGNLERLREIIKEGEISSKLAKGFPLDKLTDRENFISLLFYFGLLAIKEADAANLVLEIPNETIRRLYYDFIKEAYEETDIFALDFYTYNRLITGMALRGEWKPFFDYISGRMRESMSLRDLITGEKSIQAFLNVYLGLNDIYIIHVEKELNKGYADIVMEPFIARYADLNYTYILELKYVKAGMKPGDPKIRKLKSEAEAQLRKYSIDEKFTKTIEKTTLVKLVLIFSGHELIHIGAVN